MFMALYNSLEWKTTPMSTAGKQFMSYLYDEILLINDKEGAFSRCDNVKEFQNSSCE